MRHQAKSFCRICAGSCALVLTVADERVIAARGDKSNPQTQGYACIKGLYLHEAHNSPQRLLRRAPYNPACMHPDDLDALGLADGDEIEIISPHGSIPAIVAIDETLRGGVVSMSHGWGALPDEQAAYATAGSSTNLLTSSAGRDRINAMPTMSAIPVRIERKNGVGARTAPAAKMPRVQMDR